LAKILQALTEKDIPTYLCRLVDSYLHERKIIYQNAEGTEVTVKVSSGVPQGSVLGPTFWNVLYDGFLRLRLPRQVKFVAFADDVAIIATAEDTTKLKTLLESVAQKAKQWLSSVGLNLAINKTEIIELENKRHHNEFTIELDGTQVHACSHLRYLSIELDQKLKFTAHTKITVTKANKAVQNLSRILPNISAAKHRKRLLLANTIHSLLLYGSPTWPCIK